MTRKALASSMFLLSNEAFSRSSLATLSSSSRFSGLLTILRSDTKLACEGI
jgi:hypothetical protein